MAATMSCLGTIRTMSMSVFANGIAVQPALLNARECSYTNTVDACSAGVCSACILLHTSDVLFLMRFAGSTALQQQLDRERAERETAAVRSQLQQQEQVSISLDQQVRGCSPTS